jgi:hypothetical protein
MKYLECSAGTNKTDRHDITEILLKVALNTIALILTFWRYAIPVKFDSFDNHASILFIHSHVKNEQCTHLHLCKRVTCVNAEHSRYFINATFNNISVISWRSVLLVPGENHLPAASH